MTFYIVNGQCDFGIKANGGLSKFSNPRYDGIQGFHDRFAISEQLGLYATLHTGNNSHLGTELILSQVRGKETLQLDFTDQFGNLVGNGKTTTYMNITYLAIPIYYGIRINKLFFNLGVQSSIPLMSNARQFGDATFYGKTTHYETNYEKFNIGKNNFGAKAGLGFNLTNKISLESTYYYGISHIFHVNRNLGRIWQVQQILFGLRYKLFTKEKESTKNK